MNMNRPRLNIKYIATPVKLETGEKITTQDFHKICRTCMSEGAENPIFQLYYNGQRFSTILQSCTSILMQEDDSFPQNICKDCISKTLRMYQFALQCQQCEFKLKTIIEADDTEETEYKFEVYEETVDEDIVKSNTNTPLSNEESIQNEKPIRKLKINKHYGEKLKEILADNINSEVLFDNNKSQVEKLTPVKVQNCKEPSYNCKICDVTFKTAEERLCHEKEVRHTATKKFTCLYCNKRFSTDSYLKAHKRIHTQEKPHKCTLCGQRFTFRSNFTRHMRRHTGVKPYKCKTCGKGFVETSELTEHMVTHTGEKPFLCSYCGKSFTSRVGHRRHLTKHIPQPPVTSRDFKCDKCNQMFATKYHLKWHRVNHSEKKFACDVCGKKFINTNRLKRHSVVHLSSKPYACNICGKLYSDPYYLRLHNLYHTRQKPFSCTKCGKSFTQRNYFQYHMRMHSGEKPYSCEYCGKTFGLKGQLTIHQRIHTGETPCLCDICGKGFQNSSRLKRHRKIHGEVKENSNLKDDSC